jgi:hypothetical protein
MILKKILGAICLLTSIAVTAQPFFISPKGNDKNDGSIEKPFKTLLQARNAVRTVANRTDTLKVFLRGGVYEMQTVRFFKEDSGKLNAPIVYAAYPNEKVILRGSRTIDPKLFKKITDKATLQRINPSLRDKIVELDTAVFKLKNNKKYPDIFTDNGGLFDLFMDDERMPLSRYPNKGYMTIKKVIINGGGQETKTGDWATYYGDTIKKQDLPPRPGVFEYRDDRENQWVKHLDRGVWLKGYWRIPWQNEAVRVAEIDTIKRVIKLAVPVPSGIGNKYTRPEGNGKEKYWLLNLLDEIDKPGEWAYDFKDAKLYFYPPREIKNNVRVADSKEALLLLSGASNIIFEGITVEENSGDGIKIVNGNNNLIAGCTVRNVTNNAIKIEKGFNNTVKSCDLYNLGAGGVWLSGGNEKSKPRIAANHKVVNNHIHDYSQIELIYAAAVNAGFTGGGGGGHHEAVGMYVAHNLIHTAPHVGVLLGSWDSRFEYNEVFDYCRVSNDMGAFYSYDLYERFGNHTFAYNFIHDSPTGDGIYFDNDHRDMTVFGNIVALNSAPKERGTAYLFKIGSQKTHPQSITCYNNIAVNCNYSYQFITASFKGKIENNVSMNSPNPFSYKIVRDKAYNITGDSIVSGKNVHYAVNEGFMDIKNHDFNLKPDAQVFKDLPEFKAIPFSKMGLYLDEYRRKLPTDAEIKRFNTSAVKSSSEILDRN